MELKNHNHLHQLKSKIGLRSIRFVGEGAVLIPGSTPTKALSLFGRSTREEIIENNFFRELKYFLKR